MKYCLFLVAFVSLICQGCNVYNEDPNSETYKKLETDTYLDVIDSVLTFRWHFLEDTNKVPAFVLLDSLINPNKLSKFYSGTPPYGPYLKNNPASRFIAVESFSKSDKHVFLPDKDNQFNKYTDPDSIYGVIKSKLNSKQSFTGAWVFLSRICYNEEFTKGYLFYSIWWGPMAAEDFIFVVEKINGKWRICYSRMYGVS